MDIESLAYHWFLLRSGVSCCGGGAQCCESAFREGAAGKGTLRDGAFHEGTLCDGAC